MLAKEIAKDATFLLANGMELRDAFAIAAAAGLSGSNLEFIDLDKAEAIARGAYRIAEAMILEREYTK